MRELALTVVAGRHCSTSRTYLTYLRAAGLRPRKVLLVDFVGADTQYARRRRLLGDRLAWLLLQRRAPRPMGGSDAFRKLCSEFQRSVPIAIDYFSDFDFATHGSEMECVVAADYNDPGFKRVLRAQSSRTFLYTAGGRVPADLLIDPELRFLHVHPGVVPQVRGSDGLLWSLLVRGRPGASCFYMNAGIDTGDVIGVREFDRPRFPRIDAYAADDLDTTYSALLYAYDPHLRAQLFVEVMKRADSSISKLWSQPQSKDEGTSYYWMHPRLQRRVIQSLAA